MAGVRIRIQPKEVGSKEPLAFAEVQLKSSALERGNWPVAKKE